MTIQTGTDEMLKTIGVQTVRLGQLEAENANLRAELDAAKAAGESDRLQLQAIADKAKLADEVKNGRNGTVADVQEVG